MHIAVPAINNEDRLARPTLFVSYYRYVSVYTIPSSLPRMLIQTCLHPHRRFPDRHFYAIHLVGTIPQLLMKRPDQFSWYIQQRTTFLTEC